MNGRGEGFGGVLMLENKPSEESNSKSMIKISGKSDSEGGGGSESTPRNFHLTT
jgi:hypothetical protein